LFAHVFQKRDGLFVAEDRLGFRRVDGGENHERDLRGDEGVGAVLEFAGGVALGVEVRGLFELERAFAGNSVVDAATKVEEGAGVGVERR
jgi:hypothetical protein